MKNDSSIMVIDYKSLYKCKPHYYTDFDKVYRYVKEMREKYKKQNE